MDGIRSRQRIVGIVPMVWYLVGADSNISSAGCRHVYSYRRWQGSSRCTAIRIHITYCIRSRRSYCYSLRRCTRAPNVSVCCARCQRYASTVAESSFTSCCDRRRGWGLMNCQMQGRCRITSCCVCSMESVYTRFGVWITIPRITIACADCRVRRRTMIDCQMQCCCRITSRCIGRMEWIYS